MYNVLFIPKGAGHFDILKNKFGCIIGEGYVIHYERLRRSGKPRDAWGSLLLNLPDLAHF